MEPSAPRQTRRFGWRSALDVVTSLVMISAAVTLVAFGVRDRADQTRPSLQVPNEPVSILGAGLKGAPTADTVMIVYSDFQCPFCARFTREVLPEIERRYIATGKVALVFRHLPLPIHPQAQLAAAVAECAGQQGRFWDMHDRLFAEASIDEGALRSAIPRSLGLDMPQLDNCLSDVAVRGRVQASVDEANALGIRGTPAFFLGARLDDGRVRVSQALSGARPVGDFVEQLDIALAGGPSGWRSWIPSRGYDS